jgi:hypothetical protein
LLAAFDAADVSLLLLKGAALAHILYPRHSNELLSMSMS